MYTIRQNHRGGSFKSALTGQTYEFTQTPDNSDKRRAHSEMLAADQVVRQAAHARIGHAVTDAELLRYKTPDTRTYRERAAVETVHRTNVPAGFDHNHYEDRVSQLREQLARENRATRREAIEKRLKFAESASERFERELETKRAWEAKINHPEVTTARVLADSWRVLLRTSHDPDLQGLLERVEASLAHLGDTADHASCRAVIQEVEKDYEGVKLAKATGLEQQAREIRQAAREAKAEASIKPEPELEETTIE